jgi:hypothetical protein
MLQVNKDRIVPGSASEEHDLIAIDHFDAHCLEND